MKEIVQKTWSTTELDDPDAPYKYPFTFVLSIIKGEPHQEVLIYRNDVPSKNVSFKIDNDPTTLQIPLGSDGHSKIGFNGTLNIKYTSDSEVGVWGNFSYGADCEENFQGFLFISAFSSSQ